MSIRQLLVANSLRLLPRVLWSFLILFTPFVCGDFKAQLCMCVMDHFQDELPLAKITRDSAKITVEQVHGLMSQVSKHNLDVPFLVHESMRFTQDFLFINVQVIKDILFSSARQSDKTPSDQTDPEPMITS